MGLSYNPNPFSWALLAAWRARVMMPRNGLETQGVFRISRRASTNHTNSHQSKVRSEWAGVAVSLDGRGPSAQKGLALTNDLRIDAAGCGKGPGGACLVRFGSVRRSIHSAAAVALLCAALGGTACSRLPFVGRSAQEGAAAPESPIAVSLAASQETFRPGDAVIVTITVRNASDRAIQPQWIDVASVEFLLAGPGRGPARVQPLSSPNETLGVTTQSLAPQGNWSRHFIFTTITKDPGQHRLQAIYHAVPQGVVTELTPAISKALAFQVAGAPSFQRDRDGIIVKEQAVAVARQQVGRPVTDVTALLVRDAAGFLDWWVTLTIDPRDLKPGEAPRVAYFVGPYFGNVIQGRRPQPYVAAPPKPGKPMLPLPPKVPESFVPQAPAQP